ncbi:hypothetical protein [Haloarchaeobius sp. DYHT-AS-18]|uniref:hypothetical protein n=1 Tax=Haloarchaeobius sp. DYHT-AS-18 TaxID=3446117 RepID=UPI003EBC11D3
MAVRVNVDDETDRWRWSCPNGHRNWEPTNHHFWCQTCSNQPDADAVFDELRDERTGDTYHRDELELMTYAGPYTDVYGGNGR